MKWAAWGEHPRAGWRPCSGGHQDHNLPKNSAPSSPKAVLQQGTVLPWQTISTGTSSSKTHCSETQTPKDELSSTPREGRSHKQVHSSTLMGLLQAIRHAWTVGGVHSPHSAHSLLHSWGRKINGVCLGSWGKALLRGLVVRSQD